ncbi:hypothetical protein D3C71_2100820 [compost metagenome]
MKIMVNFCRLYGHQDFGHRDPVDWNMHVVRRTFNEFIFVMEKCLDAIPGSFYNLN